MIDKDTFLAGLAVLAGAFGREVDAPVQVAYYRVLGAQLTTEEFERAVAATLETETYWPSPAVLLSKVKADTVARGLAALEHVNRVTGSAGGYRFLPMARYESEFDAPTRAAISAVGGLAVIGNVNEDRYPSLQKKFAAAYAEALQPKLSASNETDSRVKQLVRDTTHVLSGRDRSAGERP